MVHRPSWPRGITAVLLGLAGSSCGADLTSVPDHPGMIRGVSYAHPPTRADSTMLARYGRIVALVRPDSVLLLESELEGQEAYEVLRALPGVRSVGPARWASDTAHFEVWLTRHDQNVAKARATFERLGGVVSHEFADGGAVAGHFQAFRLSRLNELGDDYGKVYSEVYVTTDPPVLMRRDRRGR